jgi:non-specific protein-tyrosine kinase
MEDEEGFGYQIIVDTSAYLIVAKGPPERRGVCAENLAAATPVSKRKTRHKPMSGELDVFSDTHTHTHTVFRALRRLFMQLLQGLYGGTRKARMRRIKEAITLLKNRLGHRRKDGTAPSEQICPEEKDKGKDKDRAGWVSPTYSQARAVHLDPALTARNRCLAYLDNTPEAESYRVLRTQVLQRTRCSGGNVIMVTSALPGEGKTIAAINLAFTLAREFQHTALLVDADLRKQSIHKYLGYASEKGLGDYLMNGTPVSDLITWPGIEKVTLISGGRLCHESAEILGSPRMKELVSELKERYPGRYVLFDVPPILAGADALTFAPLVDQVVVVVQAGKTSMDDVKRALRFLPKEKILGLVLNRC